MSHKQICIYYILMIYMKLCINPFSLPQGSRFQQRLSSLIIAVWHYVTTTRDLNGLIQWRTLKVCRRTWFVMADQRWVRVGSASSCTFVHLHFHLHYKAWMRLFVSRGNLVIFHSNHTQGWSHSFFIDLGRARWVSFRRARRISRR